MGWAGWGEGEPGQTTSTNNTNESAIILYGDAVHYDETIIIISFFPRHAVVLSLMYSRRVCENVL